MKKNTEIRVYRTPLLENVKLDNEISLILESDPPIYENASLNLQDIFENDPLHCL